MVQKFWNWIKPWTKGSSDRVDEEFARDTARTYTATSKNDGKKYAVKDARIFKDMVQKQTTFGKPIVKPF